MTNPQANVLRDMADVLDQLPGLPMLYIVCQSVDASMLVQVPERIGTDAERIAVADRIAEALGVACAMRSGSATYGTDYGVCPEIFTPGLSRETVKNLKRAEVTR